MKLEKLRNSLWYKIGMWRLWGGTELYDGGRIFYYHYHEENTYSSTGWAPDGKCMICNEPIPGIVKAARMMLLLK